MPSGVRQFFLTVSTQHIRRLAIFFQLNDYKLADQQIKKISSYYTRKQFCYKLVTYMLLFKILSFSPPVGSHATSVIRRTSIVCCRKPSNH